MQSCMCIPGLAEAGLRFGRLQKRLLHCVSQLCEGHVASKLSASLSTSLPTPENGDSFHPAKKYPGSSRKQHALEQGCTVCLWNCNPDVLRCGRQLRLQAKPKAILAIERFLARGSGFLAREPDACLKSLGLESICPTHHFRPCPCVNRLTLIPMPVHALSRI